MNITTLIENRSDSQKRLHCEHGLAFHIAIDQQEFLFDTGQTGAFVNNAHMLNMNLSTVKTVFISHAHYDHANGLPRFLQEFPQPKQIVVGASFFQEKVVQTDLGIRSNGIAFSQNDIEKQGHQIQFIKEMTKITPHLHVISHFPRIHSEEKIHPAFKLKRNNGHLQSDEFTDEISLVLRSEKGLVVLLGCSHPGVMNILTHIMQTFQEPIYAVLGGTHLQGSSQERIEKTAQFFQQHSIRRIGVSHCTGEMAEEFFANTFSDRFFRNISGHVFTLPSMP